MVATRRGTRTGRYEEQIRLINAMRNSRRREQLIEMFGPDTQSSQSSMDFNPEETNPTRRYHIGHPHEHPGFYRDLDEHHRHRKGKASRRDTWVPGHYRRSPLF